MKTLCFLLWILLFSVNSYSQNGATTIFPLDKLPPEGVLLDKDWKFHAGDNIEWAKPDFNDKDWADINPSLTLHELPDVKKAAIGWLRLSLDVDSSIQNKTIAFVINTLCASEVYLNGEMIYRFGNVSEDYEKETTRIFFNRPFILKLDGHAKQTLAIRFSFNKKNLYINFGGPALFMKLIFKEVNTSFSGYLKLEGFYSNWRSIQMCIYLPLGLLLFFLYFWYRRQDEYLYIGIFCSLMFTGMLLYVLCLSRDLITTSVANLCVWIGQILWFSGALCMLRGIYILLKQNKTWFFYLLIVYAFLATLFYPLFPDWAYVFAYAFYPLCYIELMRLYIIAVKKHIPGIWILLISHGIAILGVIFSTLVLYIHTNNQIILSQIFYGISFMAPSIGFSLFFAGDFARTASSLQLRMFQVQELSAKTIQQEKDKLEAVIEKQQAIENIRSKISMDIHDEIGSQLTKISLLSQRIMLNYENRKEVDANTINKITESSKEVVGNLGEIIWTVNPKHDNLQSLLSYIRNYITNFFEQTNIEYAIDFPEDIPATTISPDLKHNLFLVIKESLHNILKHADATEVKTSFQLNDQAFCFEITDNGKGIADMTGRDFGNGLINMKNRMEAVNGKFDIESVKNMGTKIILTGTLSS